MIRTTKTLARWLSARRRGLVAVLIASAGLVCAGLPAAAAAEPLPRSNADRRDDVEGPQVHAVYAIPSDGPDRALDTDGTIEDSVAGFQTWLSGEKGGRTLRMDRRRQRRRVRRRGPGAASPWAGRRHVPEGQPRRRRWRPQQRRRRLRR